MKMPIALTSRTWLQAAAASTVGLVALLSAHAADIDIYAPKSSTGNPNVVFLLDNTSNWSSNNQNWNADDAWNQCPTSPAASVTSCQELIKAIYYPGAGSGTVYPWSLLYAKNKNNVSLTQGQVQLRALKLVLNKLVCITGSSKLNVNVGISMLGRSGSTLSNGDSTGFMRFAVQPLTGTASSGTCKALLDDLDNIDSKITNPEFKAPANANYGAAMFEVFKYFGGFTNPPGAAVSPTTAGAPVGATGYGPTRFSKDNPLDDVNAFTSASKTTYRSPITASNACGNNYLVLVGNGYPNAEPSSSPASFGTSYLGYTPPALSTITSDTSRYADEWAQFLANTDINGDVEGVQRLLTYTVNTYKDKPDADQGKLLKSMAAVGGAGDGGYFEVKGNLQALVDAFEGVFANISATNSVFAATTLPVSTTTQGTYLNQVFVGMFRPDRTGSPRWVGNLKQYQFGRGATGALDLVDAYNSSAVLTGSGFFSPNARSFWTKNSVFFTNAPSGTPASASDSPDGAIVEKGGIAQQLREANLQSAASRKVYTLPSTPVINSLLSATPFNAVTLAILDPLGPLSSSDIDWARGQNNETSSLGAEDFSGSYTDGTGKVTTLGATGVRHSIHGDVLHSQPVALNYGSGRVIVYYGANDGTLRAIDGQKTIAESSTAGQELWSFVAPEHYGMLKRLRSGSPQLHLPETNAAGDALTPTSGHAAKSYGMDGPIGVFAAYATGGASVNEAIIYPTMRRGGRNVYAFDVTSPTAPKLKWKITGGSGSYTALGQTWSKPKPLILPSTISADPVIVMGGGYDPAEDTGTTPSLGNRVYVINARSGALLKEFTTSFSVPSDVTLIDSDFDGKIDRGYVADVRGNLYRISMTDTAGTLLTADRWTMLKIAEVGGKVFFAPDVVVTKSFISVLVGTGDREKPLTISTADNFVHIKDTTISQPNRAATLTLSDLTKVAKVVNDNTSNGWSLTEVNSSPTSANGCYIQLATNGEKVVNAPFTIAGATYFGTNRPKPAAANLCSADLGIARTYQFPLFCGAPKTTLIDGGGLPPSPVGGLVTLEINGKQVLTPFLIGGGKDGSSFKPDEPRPPVSPIRTRQNWRIDNGNR